VKEKARPPLRFMPAASAARSRQSRRRRQGSKPNGRDVKARGNAREPDGGTPGRRNHFHGKLRTVNLGPAGAATSDGLFHAWFYALPTMVDLWLWPEGPTLMLLLAMAVFTVQYLALFATVVGLLQFAQVAQDFISSYKHRRSAGSLMRRRA
jgi:hypothetical protein